MIESIKIKVGKNVIELTEAEAIALKDDLNKLLGGPVTFPIYPYYPPVCPQPEPFIYRPFITCNDGATSATPKNLH